MTKLSKKLVKRWHVSKLKRILSKRLLIYMEINMIIVKLFM